MEKRAILAELLVLTLVLPLSGSLLADGGSMVETDSPHVSLEQSNFTPARTPVIPSDNKWWERTTLDANRNGIHDSLESGDPLQWVGLSYSRDVGSRDLLSLMSLGLVPRVHVPAVNALLLGQVETDLLHQLSGLEGVVMVEEYGRLEFFGDIQTPATKASSSDIYPAGAWDLGVTGSGVNIALTDTGVDSEHPGLMGKHVAGYDAVCFVHSDPMCILAGGRQSDGSFDPDDGNQHGTACMGMAAATGIGPDGEQTGFYGSAPNATLIDVRIGTDVGAGPFENYLLEQEFYESAMNGLQWIIDNKDTPWQGVDETLHGIDIISLSWGITSHEGGGSDGQDMHSRILDEATLAGVTVSVAAGNDGPDNDGFSGMGSSSLSITVGSTDDQNTIERSDDTIAGYSSRGPRKDNGDNNPVNELKPDVTAPGSNIIQAEGCVSSGGCNNNIPGQDASLNSYTGRGSGTSYATPAVTGVIALMIEANPSLDPLIIREILKKTAERRGEPTFPEIDPYWNRDFGWGMVDARKAVEMALHMANSSDYGKIDWTKQAHLLNSTEYGGEIVLKGHSWAIEGQVSRVEYRIGYGDWKEVDYERDNIGGSALTPFNWSLIIDNGRIGPGAHDIEIRAVGDSGSSIPIVMTVEGSISEEGESKIAFAISILAATLLASMAIITLFRSRRGGMESEESVMMAEIVDQPLH
tara:strand:- start:14511 stop:16598 length:2088 start_codon:yes stop_codon:yes gene_type:complete